MRRSLTVRLITITAACLLLWVSASAGAGLPAHTVNRAHLKKAPTHLMVDAQEWSLWPSRAAVPTGTVIVQLWNRGQDQHDLRIRRLNSQGKMVGPVLGKVRITDPGQISQSTWHLKTAGEYEVYCSLPGHLMMGMHARLKVTRSRS